MADKYDFQDAAVETAVATLLAGESALFTSPTGSGKTTMQVRVLQRVPDLIQTTPSLEISRQFYKKLTGDNSIDYASEDRQRRACETNRIWTVKRLLNAIVAGEVGPPKYLQDDEAHHSPDATHDDVHLYSGRRPRIGWTATGYRGTPAETARLRAIYGKPHAVLTLRDAVARGIIARPDFVVWPLLNDETIDVSGGEFVVNQVESELTCIRADVVSRIVKELYDPDTATWRRATMLRLPGVESAESFTLALRQAGAPAVSVTGATPRAERDAAFECCVNRTHALVQVKVVGEGVDLPIRVCVDLAPTMSPVVFMQGSTGRITRPTDEGEAPPLYIACNHNITRHAYLWEGLIPPSQIKDAQTAWGPNYVPSRRVMARALGLEGFGRFVPSQVPMADGSWASLYAIQTSDGLHLYGVLLHPAVAEPMYFEKTNGLTGRMIEKYVSRLNKTIEVAEKKWGKWKKIPSVPEAEGYLSVKPGKLTDGQKDFWKSAATGRGLDGEAEVDVRQFQALPMLLDTRQKFRFTNAEE